MPGTGNGQLVGEFLLASVLVQTAASYQTACLCRISRFTALQEGEEGKMVQMGTIPSSPLLHPDLANDPRTHQLPVACVYVNAESAILATKFIFRTIFVSTAWSLQTVI